ncbi:Membrane protein putative [Haloplasma contractile SSD-17B]|uniref:Membrane protein putative n=1 Tax=Haloplasma contractile SSD-17B TaxID=1033810 RepID=U2ED57_9MOLU|nr:Membrane protein putative [Haloplasma contractile SSD-17B]
MPVYKDEKLNKIIKLLVIALLSMVCIYILSQFTGIISTVRNALAAVLIPFLIAFFINFIIYPFVKWMENLGLRPRWLVVTIIFIVIFGGLGLVFYSLSDFVFRQLESLIIDTIPSITSGLMQDIKIQYPDIYEKILEIYEKSLEGTDQVQGINDTILKTAVGVATSIPKLLSALLTAVLVPIILFYFLKDHNEISDGFYNIMPDRYKEHFVEITKRINDTIGLYIRGQLIIMIAIGTTATLGYKLIGLEYAIIFGIIVGLTNIIPYIGAMVSSIVPIVYAILAKGDNPEWYYILLLNFGFQFIEGNILQPVIMSKQLDMHPLVILAAILGFGSLFGVIGVILAVPITGITKVIILYYKEVRAMSKLESAPVQD